MAKKNQQAKQADATTLTCTRVQRIAFDCEEVVLENSSLKVTLQVKDPALHGNFEKGKEYKNAF